MNPISEQISRIGVVPVIKLNHPEQDAVPLAAALCEGGLPVAEVTFRAAGAADATGAAGAAGRAGSTGAAAGMSSASIMPASLGPTCSGCSGASGRGWAVFGAEVSVTRAGRAVCPAGISRWGRAQLPGCREGAGSGAGSLLPAAALFSAGVPCSRARVAGARTGAAWPMSRGGRELPSCLS